MVINRIKLDIGWERTTFLLDGLDVLIINLS